MALVFFGAQTQDQNTNAWYLATMGIAMGKNTSFSLGDHFSGFIEEQVTQGRFSNASDVVRAGLRLLEEQEAKLSALRAALIDGEKSGPSTPFDFDAYIARKHKAATPTR
jgi:antitoxin ParD1/3/4